MVDGLTASRSPPTPGSSTDELIAGLAAAGPVAARWRASRRPHAPAAVKERCPTAPTERWRMGYLFDIILTRDTWMHRVDVARPPAGRWS